MMMWHNFNRSITVLYDPVSRYVLNTISLIKKNRVSFSENCTNYELTLSFNVEG